MSAYGYDRLIRPLYRYKPSTPRALAALAHADDKDDAARLYFADLLRLITIRHTGGAQISRLCDLLDRKIEPEKTVEELRQELLAKLRG